MAFFQSWYKISLLVSVASLLQHCWNTFERDEQKSKYYITGMCSLTHKITHYCGRADTSHKMTKSCHTTLFVWEWPRTLSPYATLWKWKAEKQEIPYSFKYCHSSVLLSVTFSLQKQTPLQRKSFHTTVLYFSLMLCLPGAGRRLPPSYSGTHLSGDPERKRAGGSHACPSVIGAGSGTCHFLSQALTWPLLRAPGMKCALPCARKERSGECSVFRWLPLVAWGGKSLECVPLHAFLWWARSMSFAVGQVHLSRCWATWDPCGQIHSTPITLYPPSVRRALWLTGISGAKVYSQSFVKGCAGQRSVAA